MYWPVGGARVYINTLLAGRARSTNNDASEQTGAALAKTQEDETIIDLCVARQRHLFVTLTQSTLSVWRTDVSGIP